MPKKLTKIEIDGSVHCADFVGRDQHITYGFSAEDVERLIEKVLSFLQAGGVFLPVHGQYDVFQIEHQGQKLVFHPGAARQLAQQRDLNAYLLSLIVDQDYQRWATRFVPLAGKMDLRQVIEGLPISYTELIIPTGDTGIQALPIQRPLESIAEAMGPHLAFVILGEPGAGKTTTLQRIAYDAACDLLHGKTGRVPLFVRLSQQGDHDPYAFLQTEWERRTGVDFADVLAAARLLILADGINEIPRAQRNQRLLAWMLFEQQYRGGNQLVFSGREKDYDNQLNLPRVLVEPLDEPRIAQFLRNHQAHELAGLLDDRSNRLHELAKNPLNLFVLVAVYHRGGKNLQLLANRGRLFQAFTQELLHHEQRWHPDNLSVDAKVQLFSQLAFAMQEQGLGTTFTLEDARRCIPTQLNIQGEDVPVDLAALFRFGRGASILDPATLPEVRFYHHVLQEYFAALELLRRFNVGEDLSFRTYLNDPSWREIILLSVGLLGLRQPLAAGEMVRQILTMDCKGEDACQNVLLAGACLDDLGETGLGRVAANDVITALEQVSLDRSLPPATQRDAGYILGRLAGSSPAYLARIRPDLDEFIQIKADPPFAIAKYPVTNLQYRRFVEAGGYDDERWWSADGWAWRNGRWDSQLPMEFHRWLARRSVEERNRPFFWQDTRLNNPLAPVVGVSWFEAEAYCNWYSDQKGNRPVCLPTEQEWERAAAGKVGWKYPWGDKFDPYRLNCADFWARRTGLSGFQNWKKKWLGKDAFNKATTSIVGQFLAGASTEGVHDLSGNVWEWTSSWLDDEQINRVLRGGSFDDYGRNAHCTSRFGLIPDPFDTIVGFRILSPGTF